MQMLSMHCGTRLSCSDSVKQRAWAVLTSHAIWQPELVVNRWSPGKGKRLFPHASCSSLFQKSTLAKQAASAPLIVCKLITRSFFLSFFHSFFGCIWEVIAMTVIWSEQEALISKGTTLSDSSSFVRLSALVHPWDFPWGRESETDAIQKYRETGRDVPLCYELRLTHLVTWLLFTLEVPCVATRPFQRTLMTWKGKFSVRKWMPCQTLTSSHRLEGLGPSFTSTFVSSPVLLPALHLT